MERTTIGQYRVTGVIGQGGMGTVYAADHALLGRPAAVKVLLPELSQKQDVVVRFFNEARAATAIRHPGIVEIYDFGWTAEGAAFIVMEQLDGETLARRLSRGRFAWQAAFAVARQIAGALGAAHGKGIVHRDLKPDNVFLVHDPEVPGGERIKLLDFGIAKLAGDASAAVNVTRTGAVLGTPSYMAPEQCRGVAVDHRADIYALGCVVFELCSGQPPYVGEGCGDVLAAHIHLPVPSLRSRGIDAPFDVEQLIARLLAKSPAQRVQTTDEVIRTIDALVGEHGAVPVMRPSVAQAVVTLGMTTTLSGASTSEQGGTRARHRRSVAIVAAVAATICVGIVSLVMRAHGVEGVAAGSRSVVPVPVEPVRAEPARSGPGQPVPSPVAKPTEPVHRAQPGPPGVPASVPAPPSDISFDSAPSGALVLLDNRVIGKTPFRRSLASGDADPTLVVRLAGYVDFRFVVRAGKPVPEVITLARAQSHPLSDSDLERTVNPFHK